MKKDKRTTIGLYGRIVLEKGILAFLKKCEPLEIPRPNAFDPVVSPRKVL